MSVPPFVRNGIMLLDAIHCSHSTCHDICVRSSMSHMCNSMSTRYQTVCLKFFEHSVATATQCCRVFDDSGQKGFSSVLNRVPTQCAMQPQHNVQRKPATLSYHRSTSWYWCCHHNVDLFSYSMSCCTSTVWRRHFNSMSE